MTSPDERGTDTWRAEVLRWIDAVGGVRRTGEPEQRHRTWSTVLRVPTVGGPVWFKAAGPGVAAEVGLYELLTRVVQNAVLAPLAVDVDRGWLLLPDGGPTLRDTTGTADLSVAMTEVLPRYAALQRTLAPHVSEIAAHGVTDMTSPCLPARYDEAVALLGDPGGDRRARLVGWCAELAAAPPIPASLDHNDLHAGNVLVSGATYRFYDWGDAVLAHPFASLLVALQSLRATLGVSADDPAVTRPRDAYLEVFTDLAPRRELVAAADRACRAAVVARALTWHRAVVGDPQFGHTPRAVLEAVGDPSWLAGA